MIAELARTEILLESTTRMLATFAFACSSVPSLVLEASRPAPLSLDVPEVAQAARQYHPAGSEASGAVVSRVESPGEQRSWSGSKSNSAAACRCRSPAAAVDPTIAPPPATTPAASPPPTVRPSSAKHLRRQRRAVIAIRLTVSSQQLLPQLRRPCDATLARARFPRAVLHSCQDKISRTTFPNTSVSR